MRIRRKKQLSIDELVTLYDAGLEKQDLDLSEQIHLGKRLIQAISRDPKSDYRFSLDRIEKNLIHHLVLYASYLKIETERDDQLAITHLKQALTYDSNNPLARYRLGFLYYQKANYSMALDYFQTALDCHKLVEAGPYSLQLQQVYNAQLYLCNSALYLAEKSLIALREIEDQVEKGVVPNLPLSSLYEQINQNEKQLFRYAYTIHAPAKRELASIDQCEELIENKRASHLILFFSDREIILYYRDRWIHLAARPAEILKRLMLDSQQDCPLTKDDFSEVFSTSNGEIKTNTYITSINRLRAKLAEGQIPSDLIVTRERSGSDRETAYYYNHTYPFFVINRTDWT